MGEKISLHVRHVRLANSVMGSPLTVVSFMDENFIIKVLARALSEDANCSSNGFQQWLGFIMLIDITMNASRDFGLYEHHGEAIRSLPLFIKSNLVRSTGFSDHRKRADCQMELGESSLMTIGKKDLKQAKKKEKGKVPPQNGIKKEPKCFFCKKKGHMKKGCTKFQQWLEKKGYAKPKETNGK